MSRHDNEAKVNIHQFVKDVQTQPSLQAELMAYVKTQRLEESLVLAFARAKGYEVGYQRNIILQVLAAEEMQLEDHQSNYYDLLTEYKDKYREFNLDPTARPLAMLFLNIPVSFIDRAIRLSN